MKICQFCFQEEMSFGGWHVFLKGRILVLAIFVWLWLMDSQMERWTGGCVRMSIQKRDMHQNWHHLGKRMVLRLFPILEQTHLTRVVRCLSPCGGFQVSWRVAAVPKRWCIVIILSMLYDMVMTCMVISATVFWTAFSIWWFQICLIFTLFAEDFSNLTNIFQMGWNHQPVFFRSPPKKEKFQSLGIGSAPHVNG